MTQTANLGTAAENKKYIILCFLYDPEEEPTLQLKESSILLNVKMLRQRRRYFMSGTVELSISLATFNTALWLRISEAHKVTFQDSKDSGDTNLSVLSEQWRIQSQYIFSFFFYGRELDS